MTRVTEIKKDVVSLLKNLISIESFSREEDKTASILFDFFKSKNLNPKKQDNNVWCLCNDFDKSKKTVLLNSHHDTVKAGSKWLTNPFEAVVEGDKITGLGSNDAGASAVAMIGTFLHLNEIKRDYNLIVAITAEEEISGEKNVASILPVLGNIDLAIVGEPTGMNMAIAERGLIVLDCYSYGKTGHAARKEGENAIYKAMKAVEWFNSYQFEKESDFLGPVKMTVTQINAGKQHNVVPDICHMVVDVRVNEFYKNKEVLEIIQEKANCEVKARSLRLNSSMTPLDHPIVKKGKSINLSTYGSPTSSDQAVMDFNTIKIGPGDSARSHTPNEYIYISEIENGVDTYIELLSGFKF